MNRRNLWTFILVTALLATFAGLTINALVRESATFDEPTHLTAGYTYWHYNDYRLNPEHPPLLKCWDALPLLTQSVWPFARKGVDDSAALQFTQQAWNEALANNDAQWFYSHNLLYGVHDSTLQRLGVNHPLAVPSTAVLGDTDFLNNANRLLILGRLLTVVLGVGLGLLIFFWARELFGNAGGVFALALYCFDPNFIAHSGLVTTDVGVALFMTGTIYFFWRYRRHHKLLDATLTALFFALAICSKFSAVLLLPLLVILMALPSYIGFWKRTALIVACGLTAYAMLWASYGFRFSAANETDPIPLPAEQFLRRAAAERSLCQFYPQGIPEYVIQQTMPTAAISLSGKLMLFALHQRLLPEAYVYGFSFVEMKSVQRASYLLGNLSNRGWWYYFPIAFVLKTPLVTMIAMIAALTYFIFYGGKARRALFYLLIPVVLYLAASMLSRLNIGHRHLLPVYPFLFVLCGSLGLCWEKLAKLRTTIAIASLAVVAGNTQFVFWKPAIVSPNYLAYFNELASGPDNGYMYLVDSNLDWGQDLKKLRSWLAVHQVTEPINLCYFGTADPRYHRISHVNLPGGYIFEPAVPFQNAHLPGYIVISATSLQGVYMPPELRTAWREFLKPAILVDTVGHSLFIYHRN